MTSVFIGQILHDTYRVEREIGRGSMGTVYEVAHLRLPRRFAVKTLRVSQSAESLARFEREATATSKLGHPNIVEIVDFNTTTTGLPYIVMELLEGEDLARRLRRESRLSLEAVRAILEQVCSALAAAHGEGVIHRDLKPENLFVCRERKGDERIKVMDFGMSKVLRDPRQLTMGGVIMGTPWYMAPEQVKGRAREADARTDIYALGVITYHLLCGRLPFLGSDLASVFAKILQADPPPLCSLIPAIPTQVGAVVQAAMSRDPAGRPATAEALWQAFASAVASYDELPETDFITGPPPPGAGPAPAAVRARTSAADPDRTLPPLDPARTQPLVRQSEADPARTLPPADPAQAQPRARLSGADQGRSLLPVDPERTQPHVRRSDLRPGLESQTGSERPIRAADSPDDLPPGPAGRARRVLVLFACAVVCTAVAVAVVVAQHDPLPGAEPRATPLNGIAARQTHYRPAADLGHTASLEADSGWRAPDSSSQTSAPEGRVPDASIPRAEAPRRRGWPVRPRPPQRPRQRYGTLTIFTEADGEEQWAAVYIDGQFKGNSALAGLRLAAGRHAIVIQREGYEPILREIQVLPGKHLRLGFKLRRRGQ